MGCSNIALEKRYSFITQAPLNARTSECIVSEFQHRLLSLFPGLGPYVHSHVCEGAEDQSPTPVDSISAAEIFDCSEPK